MLASSVSMFVHVHTGYFFECEWTIVWKFNFIKVDSYSKISSILTYIRHGLLDDCVELYLSVTELFDYKSNRRGPLVNNILPCTDQHLLGQGRQSL